MATEREQQAYSDGQRQAWTTLLRTALKELGYSDRDGHELHSMIVEREQAIAALREVCARHGDNNWEVDLHLADVIRGHLAKHLQ